MSSITEFAASLGPSGVLGKAHIGHINGALGTIPHGDIAPLVVLRAYLIVAAGLVLVRIVTLATSGD